MAKSEYFLPILLECYKEQGTNMQELLLFFLTKGCGFQNTISMHTKMHLMCLHQTYPIKKQFKKRILGILKSHK